MKTNSLNLHGELPNFFPKESITLNGVRFTNYFLPPGKSALVRPIWNGKLSLNFSLDSNPGEVMFAIPIPTFTAEALPEIKINLANCRTGISPAEVYIAQSYRLAIKGIEESNVSDWLIVFELTPLGEGTIFYAQRALCSYPIKTYFKLADFILFA